MPLILGIAALDSLADFSGRWWFPLLVFAIALADSVIPVVPSETLVIIGGVAAGAGDQNLLVIIVVAALGAFVGDNLAYQLGKSGSGFLRRTLFRGEKGDKRLEWSADQIRKRGGMMLITARFIPGGRTAVTVSSGLTHQPRAWFASFAMLAAAIWAVYASMLGFVGGRTFQDNHTKAFLLAFVVAVTVTVGMEVIRWLRHRTTGA